ncbi:type 1 glutamine amidotransferase domain-containing protein [Nocardia sp. NRRL S-836]|uniref:type 1 glutamine amidotransferase domain-containing protein n=1 Tax=Nocardia sp. NRRL S-836 TaxID=1519492 RepID=UPI0006AFDC94|nr:type 1 glutamine amidotransferase domain-containing protein [Nocardia sp. NRRL S-836]KOV80939.1 glutamine amidotransferase [Nocardia sp. NRRL S-836]
MADKKIAFLVDMEGIEQAELTDPWTHVEKAGGTPRLLAPKLGEVRAFNHLTPADAFPVDTTLADAKADDYAGAVIPGGVANSDFLRMDSDAVRLVKELVAQGKPIAAICHGPWLLVEADVVRGKMLTSFASLQTDIRNAGGDWADQEVRVCDMNGWTLVTSRNPDDLPAFNREALKAFGLAE